MPSGHGILRPFVSFAMEAEDEHIGGYLGDSMGEQLPVTVTRSPLVAPQISSIAASSDANAEITVEADRSSASRQISQSDFCGF